MSRIELAWGVCTALLFFPASYAADEVPSPISLEQALTYADKHPRTALAPEVALRHPLRQPLYLDCHNLAYNNNSSPDNQRDQQLPALVSPQDAQRLEIMQRFFDVVLADSSAVRDSENMAVYYIPLDRTKTRMELKEFSELDELVKTSLDNNAWLEERRDNADTDEQAVIDMEVRQQILELLLRLDVFKVAEERSKVDILWRDYYLERSRTLYEQEVKSDLGDAMTQQSKARLQQQQIQFCRAMALAQLNALQGKPVWPLPTAAAKTEAPAAQEEQPK